MIYLTKIVKVVSLLGAAGRIELPLPETTAATLPSGVSPPDTECPVHIRSVTLYV